MDFKSNEPETEKVAQRLADFSRRCNELKASTREATEASAAFGKAAGKIDFPGKRKTQIIAAVIDRTIAVLPWALAVIFLILLFGLLGAGEFEDAKTLEKTICARADRPEWCDPHQR